VSAWSVPPSRPRPHTKARAGDFVNEINDLTKIEVVRRFVTSPIGDFVAQNARRRK
jgi:hypothetical protein